MQRLKPALAGLAALVLSVSALGGSALAGTKTPLVNYSGQVQPIKSTDTVLTSAATTGNASINLPPGTAPTSPNNGDCWTTNAGLYCQINGVTVGPYSAGGTPGGSNTQVQYDNAGAFGGVSGVTSNGSALTFAANDLILAGATSGTLKINCAATCGTNTLTLPAGTTDFSATGGTSQVVKQTSSGAAFTVGQLGFTDLSGSASSAQMSTNLSAAIDSAFGSTQGDVLFRGASAWSALAPGTTGQFLQTQGAAANPQWAPATGGGGGGTGAITLITRTTLGVAATNITFSSISGSYFDLIVRCGLASTDAVANIAANIQFNSDSGSHYDYIAFLWNGGATTEQGYAVTAIAPNPVPGTSAPANYMGQLDFTVENYAGTTFYKHGTLTMGVVTAAPTNAVVFSGFGTFWYRSTSAITSVSVTESSGHNFIAGSWCSLYGSY